VMTGAGDKSVAWLKHEDEFPTIRRIMVDIGVRPSALPFFCIQTRLGLHSYSALSLGPGRKLERACSSSRSRSSEDLQVGIFHLASGAAVN